MSRVTREDESQDSSSALPFEGGLPLASRIEEMHLHNLQNIIILMGHMLRDLALFIEEQQLVLTDNQLSNHNLVALKEGENELKYHIKLSPNSSATSAKQLPQELTNTINALTRLKMAPPQTAALPRVKGGDHQAGHFSQLSTITEKESQENLLHNYLRNNKKSRRSKSNLNKNTFLYNTSSIEDLQFEVIREETRKSLENPYHKNNVHRKPLYNDLEKIRGQDHLLPAVKNYLDKHKKHVNQVGKLPQYQIQKLI